MAWLFAWCWWCLAWADSPIDGRLVVREPVVVGGLAVYLVIDTAASQAPAGNYKLLSQALADGTLTIQEVDAGGSVPVLKAHNKGTVEVLAMAGDVVNGGKQDRVVTQDVLIPPSKEPQPISVNCVERSRWAADGQGLSFSYAGRAESGLSKTVQVDKDQGSTWSKVAELNSSRGQAPSTGTYQASLDDGQIRAKLDASLQQLRPVADPKAVGVVVALQGALQTAEIYDNPALFQSSRDALLRSLVLDALARQALDKASPAPTAPLAAAWVKDARAAQQKAMTAQPASEYVELESDATHNYELRSKDGKKLKETIYTK
jgi:hypothetical protein